MGKRPPRANFSGRPAAGRQRPDHFKMVPELRALRLRLAAEALVVADQAQAVDRASAGCAAPPVRRECVARTRRWRDVADAQVIEDQVAGAQVGESMSSAAIRITVTPRGRPISRRASGSRYSECLCLRRHQECRRPRSVRRWHWRRWFVAVDQLVDRGCSATRRFPAVVPVPARRHHAARLPAVLALTPNRSATVFTRP